ncbi:UNKNOWN [Stylonychia lemnae]|uniref:Calcium uniporter protein C-terminal domain-containing protein n=1 Tax=Stylonychia lemnae TaxID=5949 RepID=A0A078AUV6_STYLE|nr:UNKNOWN [Stylonychia lemnae]|eukprot:CDW85989.1 UNKNOWN [Stylonychia lemnae]
MFTSSLTQLYLRRLFNQQLLNQNLKQFSTFPKLRGTSIQISSQKPPKIRIPVNNQIKYDFSLLDDETVAQFEAKVKQETGLKSFKLHTQENEEVPDQKIEELLKRKFQMQVNQNRYDVYPLFETMVDKNVSGDSQKIIDQVFNGKSIPISRRVILYHYFASIIKNLQGTNKALNQQEIEKALQQGLDDYVKSYKSQIYENPLEQLKNAEKELGDLKDKQKQLHLRSYKYASMVLYGAFSMAAAQLGGMGYLIFIKFSWEVMEPVTYMVSAFYATVGALYYLIYKSDFEMASAHELFQDKKYNQLIKSTKFDEQKIEFLESYIKDLRDQLGILQNEGEKFEEEHSKQ